MFNKEQERKIKKFSKVNDMTSDFVRTAAETSGKSLDDTLDSLAYSVSKSPYKHNAEVMGATNIKGMRNLTQGQSKTYIDSVAQGIAKESGKGPSNKLSKLYGWDEKSGWHHSVAQARTASYGQRVTDLIGQVNPFGGSAAEAWLTSMGFSGKHGKMLAAKNGGFAAFNHRFLLPATGIASGLYSLGTEDPLNNYASTVAMGAGIQQGWRIGKSAANVIGMGTSENKLIANGSRILGGGIGAVSMAAVGFGAIWAAGDATKTDSEITKLAKKFSKTEQMVSTYDRQTALTMRQAGLQKLSSSYLNNRQQLLGNEALVLKNMQM